MKLRNSKLNLFIFALLIMSFFIVNCKRKEYAKKVVLKSIKSTSQLDQATKPYKYHAMYLFDGNGSSSWCEGQKDMGYGEKITIELLKPIKFNRIYLTNGFRSQIKNKKTGKIDKKKSMRSFTKNSSIPSKIIIKTSFSDPAENTAEQKDEIVVPTDKPVVTLNTSKELIGDIIEITIKDIYFKGRSRSAKTDTCMTDIFFGLDSSNKSVRYDNFYMFKGNEKRWAEYWEAAHKEIYQFVRKNYYYYYCLSKPENPCENDGYLRGISINEGGPNGPADKPQLFFNWRDVDITYRVVYHPVSGGNAVITLKESSESHNGGGENMVGKPLNLKPIRHDKNEGLVLADEDKNIEVAFRYLETKEERNEKNITNINDFANFVSSTMQIEGFDPKNYYHSVFEFKVILAEGPYTGLEFLPIYYLLSKAK